MQETLCPLHRSLGGPQGRSGQMRKISPPPGFGPLTVSSLCADWTTPSRQVFFLCPPAWQMSPCCFLPTRPMYTAAAWTVVDCRSGLAGAPRHRSSHTGEVLKSCHRPAPPQPGAKWGAFRSPTFADPELGWIRCGNSSRKWSLRCRYRNCKRSSDVCCLFSPPKPVADNTVSSVMLQ